MIKIIIIDDEPAMLRQLSMIFKWNDSNFEVVGSFKNARDAISFIETNRVDVVISDILMPGMTGLELAEYLSINHPHVVVALISAFGDFSYSQQAIRLGVADYITKPISYEDLQNTLKRIEQRLKSRKRSQVNNAIVEQTYFQQILMSLYYDELSDAQRKSLIDKLHGHTPMEDIDNLPCMIIRFEVEGFDRLPRDSTLIYNRIQSVFPFSSTNLFGVIFRYYLSNIEIFVVAEGNTLANASELIKFEIEKKANVKLDIIWSKQYSTTLKFQKEDEYLSCEKDDLSDDIISAATAYLEEHFTEKTSLSKIAETVNLSPVYFCRYFKQKTGKNITDYITSLRMKRAGELMREKDAKASMVCNILGYKNVSHFYSIFKNYYDGLTPMQYHEKETKNKETKNKG